MFNIYLYIVQKSFHLKILMHAMQYYCFKLHGTKETARPKRTDDKSIRCVIGQLKKDTDTIPWQWRYA